MNQDGFRKLISGESSGLRAAALRFSLGIAAQGYSVGVALRNFLYSRGWLNVHRANVPVISIGNITVGGTGKTPLVIWLYNFLQQKNIQCAILTRGYKARGTRDEGRETIDEPAILTECCPQAKVIVNPDRVAGATEAVNKFGAEILIMDDGFQHRRLVRDLDIVTIDATLPFGYDKTLPAGLLREPLTALRRADAAVITRCSQVSSLKLAQIEQKLKLINPYLKIAKSIHKPIYAKTADNKEISVEELKGKKIFAFCGIGNPEAFLNTIEQLGCGLAGSKIYDDHYHYESTDIIEICKLAKDSEANLILTTHKDWTKITSDCQSAISECQSLVPFAYLAIELRFIGGEDKIRRLIENVLTGKISGK